MKNLKKVLALVLAFACAFTMFAGAAFTDSADIKVDAEVVDTLVALGVVNGYDDGSFKPNGTVTRAEMAKMIYVLRTGKSDASAYNNDKTSFTDVNGHWAAGFIKYCQSSVSNQTEAGHISVSSPLIITFFIMPVQNV